MTKHTPDDAASSPGLEAPSSSRSQGQAPVGAEGEARLHQAIAEGSTRVLRQQGPDGLWLSLYEGGPVHVGAGLIATQLLEAPDARRFEVEQELIRGILQMQGPGGAWAPYPEGPLCRDATRIALLALKLFSERQSAFLAQPPHASLLEDLQRSIRAAEGFLQRDRRPPDSLFLDLLADLFWDAAYPHRSRELTTQPLSAEAAELFLKSAWTESLRNRISSFARQAVPAIALLHEKAASRSPWVRVMDGITSLLGWNRSRPALKFLEREIRKLQARTGGWLWSVLGTTLNLLALHALGRDARDPAIRRGLDFIHRLRMPGSDGTLRQSWCNAELWDSAVAFSTLLFCGTSPALLPPEPLVRVLLEEQASDGLWAFGVGALEGDNDSGAVVLATLCRLQPMLTEPLAERARRSIQLCVESLLAAQQEDGGWGYSPEPHEAPYSFGSRSPFGLETTLVDGSTPDVTGRVLAGLLSARAAGFFDPSQEERFARAWERALLYLQQSQAECGAWVGRWTAGYLSPLVFLLPVLRAAGVDMSAAWIQEAARFVRRSQNPDGGWGETPSADSNPLLAAKGPSTPVQTGYALAALVACAQDREAVAQDRALRAGKAYLLQAQVMGAWNNQRALYTVAFRDDYFDASLMTQTLVLCSLRQLALALEEGPLEAMQQWVMGSHAGNSRFARLKAPV